MTSQKLPILISAVILISILGACGSDQQEEMPSSLEDKKLLLAEKQAELRDIQNFINNLKDEIAALSPTDEKAAIPVETITIERDTFRRFIKVQANVEAEDVVNASSEIGGRLTGVYVKEGDYVRRGALIATTDVSTLENQLIELQTSLSLATTVFERQKRLWDQNIGSEIQFLEARNNKERLEKSIETLKSQMAKKNIYAPISGVVDQKFLNAGEMASPGMPVVQILDTDKINIKADLQESLLGKVKTGDKVRVYFPALDLTIEEKIDRIGRTIDRNNRTFVIEMATDSRKGILKPNLLAEVRINDYTKQEAVTVPLYTIKEEVTGRKYVYLVKDTMDRQVAQKSYVELGESNDGFIVIEKGVHPGDRLVIAGGGSLTDNDPVIINQDTIKSHGE